MPLYSDVNQYSPHKHDMIYDVSSVYQSLDNLLTTRTGERLFDPIGWPDLEKELHKLMSDSVAFSILNKIVMAIQMREPRVNLLLGRCNVTPDYDNHVYDIDFVFSLRGYESDGNFSYSGTLETE